MEFINEGVITAFLVCVAAAMATVIGGAAVLFMKKSNPRFLAFGLAFAGGAMVYISLIEIFGKSLSAFSQVYQDHAAYALTTFSFFAGVAALMALDRLIPNPHGGISFTENDPHGHGHAHHHSPSVKRLGVLTALAITAHNFPEGIATFFATLDDPVVGAPLAVAIAIHNIPEGVSIAIPIYFATGSKKAAIIATFLSALAEPVGAAIGYAILMPFLSDTVYAVTFGMIAGAMVFLSLDELLPTAKRYSSGHETTYGMVLGMMALAASLVLMR